MAREYRSNFIGHHHRAIVDDYFFAWLEKIDQFQRSIRKTKTKKTTMITRDPITNEQEIDGLCDPRTAAGHPANTDGPVRWEVLDGNSTLGTISADGKTAVLRSEDGIGTSHFKATADADLGAGIQEISETYELVVIAPNAATVGGSFGEPRLKT